MRQENVQENYDVNIWSVVLYTRMVYLIIGVYQQHSYIYPVFESLDLEKR